MRITQVKLTLWQQSVGSNDDENYENIESMETYYMKAMALEKRKKKKKKNGTFWKENKMLQPGNIKTTPRSRLKYNNQLFPAKTSVFLVRINRTTNQNINAKEDK